MDLPRGTRNWPGDRPLPEPLAPSSVVSLEDGLYSARWPNGRLRLFAAVEDGRVRRWLTLEETGKAGCIDLGNTAQTFSAEGRLENFSPWDDNSPSYVAQVDFASWVQEQVRAVVGEEPGPQPVAPAAVLEPIPPLPAILKDLEAWPGTHEFGSQLQFHVESRFHLDALEAASVTECLSAAFDDGLPEFFWEAHWEGRFGCRRRPWTDLALFREARLLQPSKRIRRNLDACSTHLRPSQGCRIRFPGPKNLSQTCPLRALQVLCELLLRQEASRKGSPVVCDEKFLARASLAGALLLAPDTNAPLDFVDRAQPWRDHPVAEARAELTGLKQHLARGGKLSDWIGSEPVLAEGVSGFFLARLDIVRRLFDQLASGHPEFPMFARLGPWPSRPPSLTSEQWRELAGCTLALLPANFARMDQVDAIRLQNRLAGLGPSFAGGERDPRLEAYLAKHRKLEGAVLKQVGISPVQPDWLNATLFVLEGFRSGARTNGTVVLAASKIAWHLSSRLVS